MKSKILLLITSVLTLNMAQAQTENGYDQIKGLGLVAYLAEVKTLSEAKMEAVLNHLTYLTDKAKVKEANAAYTHLRMYVDQLVLQVIADCKRKNNICLYRKLDNHFKKDATVKNEAYKKLLEKIDSKYTDIEKFSFEADSVALTASVEEITGAAEMVWGIIESARDFREKKVAGLAEILDTLRLKSINELKKKEKE